MGTHFAHREINGACDDVHHHDPAEESEAVDVSRQTSIPSMRHLTRSKTDTSTANRVPRLRHQHFMGTLSALYLESSPQYHRVLSEVAIPERGSRFGTITGYENHSDIQTPVPSISDAHKGDELKQERPNGMAQLTNRSAEGASKTMAEAGTGKEAGLRNSTVPEVDVEATSEEDGRKPERGFSVGRRAASAEPMGTVVRNDAKEVTKAHSAGLLRVNNQDDTKHGDDLAPQRHCSHRMSNSEKLAASPQLQRAIVDTAKNVATRKSEGVSPPSERIQKLMARFDSDIKARVEADVERRRRRRQGIIFSALFPSEKPEDSQRPHKQEKQGQRPRTTGPDWAPSLQMIRAGRDMAPSDIDGMRTKRGSSAAQIGVSEEERNLNTEAQVEDKVSVGLDETTGSSYEEASIVQEHAVAAQIVNLGKPRLVRISGHHAIHEDGASRGTLQSQPSEFAYPKRLHCTHSERHLVTRHGSGDAWHRDDFHQKRQLGQADDFTFSIDLSDGWPEEADEDDSTTTSPIDEPIAPFSYDFAKSEDSSSLVSEECAGYTQEIQSPPMPLFSMPNSPFLYNTDHDDEWSSLIIDDDQDRRIEDTMLIGLALSPSLPSPRIQVKPDLGDCKDNT
ncbi:hypothetical protein VPNG_07486 [Cytospora leucostoma]|uniref:Uncharacterized protein n=1 Tax=Cytospora leucostoma TaxID=1230097 RepID=A0A423WSR2_9PEZI|nr:hypothetical protein VPNG_07486 [Cytospora leucostoma]